MQTPKSLSILSMKLTCMQCAPQAWNTVNAQENNGDIDNSTKHHV